MYRMGWKREDKILYYSEFLGRRDKIDDEDMMTLEDKSKYEKQLETEKKEREILEEKFKELEKMFKISLKEGTSTIQVMRKRVLTH